MDDFEQRLVALEARSEFARIEISALREVLTTTLGFIVLEHGESGRAFVQGLKTHDRLHDPHTDIGPARPDYEKRFRAEIDALAERALSATRLPPNQRG